MEKFMEDIKNIFSHYTENNFGQLVNGSCICNQCVLAESIIREFNKLNIKLVLSIEKSKITL